jgi:hypothetical protein
LKGKKKTSIASIDANRKNALISTGPKTDKGKKIVKWNALKHGLLSEGVVIKAGDGQECIEDFNSLLGQLRTDLQPLGILEEMLVEKIAVCYWRLRRVLRCEVGEIRRELDTAVWDRHIRRADGVEHERRFAMLDSSRRNLTKTSLGIQYLINVLGEARATVKDVGHLTDEVEKKLIESFGHEEKGFTQTCMFLSLLITKGPQEADQDQETDPDSPSPAKCKKILLDTLSEQEKALQKLKSLIEENEKLELEAHLASLALPSREVIEKILRYETTIERQLYRAISQLERLQRQRKGEIVPPPVSLDVSTES